MRETQYRAESDTLHQAVDSMAAIRTPAGVSSPESDGCHSEARWWLG